MHEVALSQQLARLVSRAAEGRKVLVVRLEIGALRQVVPESLAYAWTFVTKGTNLGDSELDVQWRPAVLRCGNGHESRAGDGLTFICPRCGGAMDVLSGDQFRVIDIDVDVDAGAPPAGRDMADARARRDGHGPLPPA
ncbi:hydrogenase maturation nickel metallochaperone HypA [Corynebacterium sp. 335C]